LRIIEEYNDSYPGGIMRSIFLFAILFFLLTACSQTPIPLTQTPTVEPTNTPLPTSTGTPAPSATPTATYTPTAVPTLIPEQKLEADAARFGITAEMMSGKDAIYTVGYDKDGKITLTDKKGILVYWDGKWNSKKIVALIDATGDCEGTKYPPASPTANWANLDVNQEHIDRVLSPMTIKAMELPFFVSWLDSSITLIPVPFRNARNCWGQLLYQDKPKPRVDFIWKKLNKVVTNVEVFEPKK
jgi:hypothetical protein